MLFIVSERRGKVEGLKPNVFCLKEAQLWLLSYLLHKPAAHDHTIELYHTCCYYFCETKLKNNRKYGLICTPIKKNTCHVARLKPKNL